MRVLILPDKFKGTLTAAQAAEAVARGWRAVRPEDELDLLPMTDGGDGFGGILGGLLGAAPRVERTVNAAHEPVEAEWWWSATRQTAVVESAKVIGLAMLPPGRWHPFELDTSGLGRLARAIGRKQPGARLMMGIGGSATNDAGFGFARGLGFQFEDAQGRAIRHWPELDRLARILPPEDPPRFSSVVIASDVQNPLLGPDGASRIYGPQKGLRPEDFPAADRCFERLAEMVRKDLGRDCAAEPGAGAAGGLGYGLRVFTDGVFRPGFEIFAEAARLPERMAAADLAITGEGALDRQTGMGKGTGAVARLARAAGKRCIALAGVVAPEAGEASFEFALGIVPGLASEAEAKADASHWLARLAAEAARRVSA